MTFNTSRAFATVALIAAATGIALAPTASAQTKQPAPTHEQLCTSYGNNFDSDVNEADKADKAGNTSLRDDYLALASSDLSQARAEGCDWAAARRVPSYPAHKVYVPQSGQISTRIN